MQVHVSGGQFFLKNKQLRFFSTVTKNKQKKRHKNQLQMFMELHIVQPVQTEMVFTFQLAKILVSTTVKSANFSLMCSKLHLRIKNRQKLFRVEMVHIVLKKRRFATTEKINKFVFSRNFSAHHNQAHPNLCHERIKSFYLWHRRGVDSPFEETVNQIFNCILILYFRSLQQSNIFCSVSNVNFEGRLDFERDFVTVIIKNLVQEVTINPQ